MVACSLFLTGAGRPNHIAQSGLPRGEQSMCSTGAHAQCCTRSASWLPIATRIKKTQSFSSATDLPTLHLSPLSRRLKKSDRGTEEDKLKKANKKTSKEMEMCRLVLTEHTEHPTCVNRTHVPTRSSFSNRQCSCTTLGPLHPTCVNKTH